MKKESVDQETGLVHEGSLNQVIHHYSRRADGSVRLQQDFQYCPTMAEQHTANQTDINYLIAKYKPDELAAYIAARGVSKQEIIGHDFSKEPSLQDARNITYHLKKSFDELPDEVKNNFRNHVEFLKFIDNPANQEKMLRLGLMTKKQIKDNTKTNNDNPNDDKQNQQQQTKQTKPQESQKPASN